MVKECTERVNTSGAKITAKQRTGVWEIPDHPACAWPLPSSHMFCTPFAFCKNDRDARPPARPPATAGGGVWECGKIRVTWTAPGNPPFSHNCFTCSLPLWSSWFYFLFLVMCMFLTFLHLLTSPLRPLFKLTSACVSMDRTS